MTETKKAKIGQSLSLIKKIEEMVKGVDEGLATGALTWVLGGIGSKLGNKSTYLMLCLNNIDSAIAYHDSHDRLRNIINKKHKLGKGQGAAEAGTPPERVTPISNDELRAFFEHAGEEEGDANAVE